MLTNFQYSIGDARLGVESQKRRCYVIYPFNTPLEMLGVLVFGFCGFLSFCDGGVWVSQGAC